MSYTCPITPYTTVYPSFLVISLAFELFEPYSVALYTHNVLIHSYLPLVCMGQRVVDNLYHPYRS